MRQIVGRAIEHNGLVRFGRVQRGMDIIESHRLGLIEQLESEAVALAGRGRDAGQRALVCHHVADLLGLAHGYALLSALGALAIDDAVAQIERRARWAIWRLSRDERAALLARIATFGDTLRALDAERCAGLLMSYRLVATPSLGAEAERRLDPDLLGALRAAQSARGQADAATRRALFDAHTRWAEELIGARLDAALAALAWPLGGRALDAAIAALRIPAKTLCARRAQRAGAVRTAVAAVGSAARGVCGQSRAGLFPAPAPDRRTPPPRRRGRGSVRRRRGATGGLMGRRHRPAPPPGHPCRIS